MYDVLSQDVKYLKGVGPKRSVLLKNEAGISSLHDLLYYLPYKYIDRSHIYKISEVQDGMANIQIIAQIKTIYENGRGRKRRLEALVDDGTGVLRLVWFNGINYIHKRLEINKPYLIFGKPTEFNHEVNIAQPEMTLLTSSVEIDTMARLRPVYSLTESMRNAGITSSVIEQLVANVFEKLDTFKIPETLPEYFRKKYSLMDIEKALHIIHFPENTEVLPEAERRLKFEELFYVQLEILNYANQRTRKYEGFVFSRIGDHFIKFYHESLPFDLTNAQKRVIREIRKDLGSGRQMNRLLQGDVGSGKTIVALMTMLIAIDNGYQACIMAPTEILSEQHYYNVSRMLSMLNVRVELLTGAVIGKRRKQILEDVANGEIDILVGTHALLGDIVNFKNLGMAIIDEQHRFGVEQRAKLWKKNTNPPHILVMTATPIPRTLAMTVYGDLSVSVIDELPPGRKAVQTLHFYEENKEKLIQLVRSEIASGRQVYFVYPLIEESEKADMKDLENGYEQICQLFADMNVGKLHGRMKDDEKNTVMELFKDHQLDILVSTTVIEVGVDVPNASVMVIVNANRFGLAQLHQLRGRVGRGAEQSFCILLTGYKLSEVARRRLEIMVDSTDGFFIAEEDLKLRGPGVLEGTQQSGVIFELKLANVIKDNDLLVEARTAAQELLLSDPEKQNSINDIIWQQLAEKKKNKVNLSNIS
ncbi:MAG: ATP-dependent DNA helicase RecG [Bacteroidaceae bacterium]|nr:ATP-dependent DNA helicase RecG [Bacteroidaceae bacterium]